MKYEINSSENQVSIIYSLSYLLLNLNNNVTYEKIKNTKNLEVINYLSGFTDMEFNPENLILYLDKWKINMSKIKKVLLGVISENKEQILLDLEEQYISVKKQLIKYSAFNDGILMNREKLPISFSNFHSCLEKEFKTITHNLNIINVNKSSEENNILNISSIKQSLDNLEKSSIKYRVLLCEHFGIHKNQWKTLYSKYSNHIKPLNEEEILKYSNSAKRYLNNFEKNNSVDYISKIFQDCLFVKVKKKASSYSVNYGISFLDKKDDSDFVRKILQEKFSVEVVNLWKQYSFNFLKMTSDNLFKKLEYKNITLVEFYKKFDEYMEKNPIFEEILTKSIKEAYRKTPSRLLIFDSKTSFISFDNSFLDNINKVFLEKIEPEFKKFEKTLSGNDAINNFIFYNHAGKIQTDIVFNNDIEANKKSPKI